MSGQMLLRALPCALLLAAAPGPAAGQLNLGLEVGLDSGNKDAVEGFPSTRFDSSTVFSASLGYRFGFGLELGLAAHRLTPELKEGATNFGKLSVQALLVRLGYRLLPAGTGFGMHAAMGFGVSGGDFEKGPFLTDLERQNRISFGIFGKDGFAFDAEFGVDYLVTSWLAITGSGRLLVARQDTRWTASGPAGTLPVNDISAFVLVSGQVGVGIRVWFWR